MTDALNRNLQLLALIRTIVTAGQVLAFIYFSSINDLGLQTRPLIIILSTIALFTGLTWLRLARSRQVSELEFFAHLCADICALTVLLYFSGGASNPFVSYFIVPIAIGSSILRWNFSAALAAFGLAAYSLLLFFYVPVHALMSHGASEGLSLHLAGMWLNFAVSALLIAYFIVHMAQTINQQKQQLARQREHQMETDRLIAVATLAANTAHQLGTPINSISLLATELNEVSTKNDDHQIHQQLAGQIDRCKSILNSLVHTADLALQDGHQEVLIQQYFTDLIDRWSVLHPDQSIHLDRHSLASADRSFTPSTSLEPAIFNLLNNAAQSGGDRIEISFDFRENHMQMRLSDNGSGIPNEIMQRLGQPFNSNKPEGMGIGLYLAITTIEAMGGSIAFIPNTTSTKGTKEATGTTLDLNLPIRATEK